MATVESDSVQSRQSAWKVFVCLSNPGWLQSAWKSIIIFLRILLPAQAMILGGEVFMTIVSRLALGQMNAPTISIPGLLLAFVFLMLGLVLGAPLLLYGLAKIIFRLTGFCRFWLMEDHVKVDPNEDFNAMSVEAMKQVTARTKFLGTYWFYSSLLLFVPLILAAVLLCIKFLISGNFDMLVFHSSTELIVIALLALSVAYIITVSALMFPVGAMQEGSPGKAALHTFAISFKLFLPSIPICVLVVLLNLASSAPDYFLKPKVLSTGIDGYLLIDLMIWVWQAAIGLILLPASILPFCELWRSARHAPN